MNKRILIFLSLLIGAAGILIISGWLFNVKAIENFIPHFRELKFNTALGLLLSGIAILILQFKTSHTTQAIFRISATLLFLIGIISCLEYAFHFNSGIDELFVDDLVLPKGEHPGRMSFTTGLCFSLLAVSFVTMRSVKKLIASFSQHMLHLVTLLSGISLIAWLYRIPSVQKFGAINPMEFQTSIALIILSSAASFINHKLGITSALNGKRIGNILSRKIFKRMALLTLIIGIFRYELIRLNIITGEVESISLVISFIVISLFVIFEAAQYINNIDSRRSQAEEALGIVNNSLSKIILDRTKELNQALDQLRESEARLKTFIGKYSES